MNDENAHQRLGARILDPVKMSSHCLQSLAEMTRNYEELLGDLLKNAPACWDGDQSEHSLAVEYVRHLEDAVGLRAHDLNLNRHRPECDGTCS